MRNFNIALVPVLILGIWGCTDSVKHNSSESSEKTTENSKDNYLGRMTELYSVLSDNIPYPSCSNFDLYLFPDEEKVMLGERFITYLSNLDTIYLASDMDFYSKQLNLEGAYFKNRSKKTNNCIVKASPIVFTKDSNYFAVYIQKINLQDSIENETYIFHNEHGKWKHVAFSIEPAWN